MKPLLACEVPLDKVNFPIYVSTKYDGCFTWGTKVWTEKGLIPIGKIVDEKLNITISSQVFLRLYTLTAPTNVRAIKTKLNSMQGAALRF